VELHVRRGIRMQHCRGLRQTHVPSALLLWGILLVWVSSSWTMPEAKVRCGDETDAPAVDEGPLILLKMRLGSAQASLLVMVHRKEVQQRRENGSSCSELNLRPRTSEVSSVDAGDQSITFASTLSIHHSLPLAVGSVYVRRADVSRSRCQAPLPRLRLCRRRNRYNSRFNNCPTSPLFLILPLLNTSMIRRNQHSPPSRASLVW
jgi:hypothetical protein